VPRKLIAEIVLKDRFTKQIGKVESKLRHFTRRVGNLYKRMLSLKTAIIGVGAYVGYRFVKNFTDAASMMETFGTQLMVLSKSAYEAKQALAFIREFARTSPLETEDVIRSYVMLRAIGLNPTIKMIKTLGGVALLMGLEMKDVAGALINRHKTT